MQTCTSTPTPAKPRPTRLFLPTPVGDAPKFPAKLAKTLSSVLISNLPRLEHGSDLGKTPIFFIERTTIFIDYHWLRFGSSREDRIPPNLELYFRLKRFFYERDYLLLRLYAQEAFADFY